jgi:ankyrin repeat protein
MVASQRCPEYLPSLIAAGAALTINARNSGGYTALTELIRHQFGRSHPGLATVMLPAVRLLLAAGADVNIPNRDGNTALMFAVAARKSADLVRLLLDAGAVVDSRNAGGRTALLSAIGFQSLPAVEMLLAAGADVSLADLEGTSPLIKAAQAFPEAVDPLLAIITRLPADQRLAAVNARDNQGYTALFLFISRHMRSGGAGQALATVSAMLRMGADPNIGTSFFMTPLAVAVCDVARHDVRLVRLLLAHGARCDAVDDYGQSVLMDAAAEGGGGAVVATLLAAGASVHQRDREGRQALFYGCTARSAVVVRMLLEAGADFAAEDDEGATALMSAVECDEHDDTAVLVALLDFVVEVADAAEPPAKRVRR